VQVDRPSEDSATLEPGSAVEVKLLDREVMVAEAPSTTAVASSSMAAAGAARS
jgi:hypothetical protein